MQISGRNVSAGSALACGLLLGGGIAYLARRMQFPKTYMAFGLAPVALGSAVAGVVATRGADDPVKESAAEKPTTARSSRVDRLLLPLVEEANEIEKTETNALLKAAYALCLSRGDLYTIAKSRVALILEGKTDALNWNNEDVALTVGNLEPTCILSINGTQFAASELLTGTNEELLARLIGRGAPKRPKPAPVRHVMPKPVEVRHENPLPVPASAAASQPVPPRKPPTAASGVASQPVPPRKPPTAASGATSQPVPPRKPPTAASGATSQPVPPRKPPTAAGAATPKPASARPVTPGSDASIGEKLAHLEASKRAVPRDRALVTRANILKGEAKTLDQTNPRVVKYVEALRTGTAQEIAKARVELVLGRDNLAWDDTVTSRGIVFLTIGDKSFTINELLKGQNAALAKFLP